MADILNDQRSDTRMLYALSWGGVCEDNGSYLRGTVSEVQDSVRDVCEVRDLP